MRKMTITFISLVAAVVFLSLLVGSVSFAKEELGKTERDWNRSLLKPTGEPRYQILNINNLWTWLRCDGLSNHSPLGDNGTYFPRGTAWLIYEDGIMWGGKCYTDDAKTQSAPYGQLIRVGGGNYVIGCREGRIIGTGATAVPADPADDDSRIYRIRRDYAAMSQEELQRDAAETNETSVSSVSAADIQEIYDLYALDWNEWPVDYGAPFIDRNGNGVYDQPPPFSDTFTVDSLIAQGCDEPGIAGADPNSPADQVVWTVYNDLNREKTLSLQGSEPMGMEIQITVWGYKRTDALGNLFFRRAKIINKGGIDIDGASTLGSFWVDSMYVAQWSDPDLGSAGDDLLGCDTTLSMGYVYNGNANDNEYVKWNLPPPAAGYDFLQGPAVPGEAGDRAVFDMKYKDGFKNLPMTSFSWFSAGSPISDPPRDYTQGTLRWYKMLRGFCPKDGPIEFYPFPEGVEPNKFPYSGDPITGSGLLDGQGTPDSFAPGDRRLNCSSGPFTLAPGDTQEVVVAVVCGIGADRLSSIAVMKFNDRFAQNTYDALFQVPSAPKTPVVTFAEFDGKVILEWGSDMATVKDIETKATEPGTFVFEGYNVYQFSTRTASVSDAKRIATYDLATDPTVIMDEQFDVNSGQILNLPVQYGSNSGILRFFEFDRDHLLDIGKIYNGQEYYVAVTAYSRSTVPGYLPATLESAPTVLTVVPHLEMMGTRCPAEYLDIIPVTHAGSGDATILPVVIDPSVIVPATYTVEWNPDKVWVTVETDTTPDTTGFYHTWNLSKDGTVVLSDKKNYSLDEVYDIVDGIQFKVGALVFETPLDFDHFDVTPADNQGNFDIDSYYANGWASTAMAIDAYGAGTTDLSLLQSDIELRFTGVYGAKQGTVIPVESGGQMATVYSANDMEDHPLNPNPGSTDRFAVRIPFEVWDVERDMQINVLMRLRKQLSTADPFYAFDPADRMYCFLNALPYQETPLTEADDEMLTWNLVFWETGWTTGDIVSIQYLNKIIPGTDKFTISTAGYEQTVSAEVAKSDVERVGVFPNPYYAFNPAERNKLARFVTFNNLSPVATIRLFNLAGQLVRKLEKDDNSPFMRWDLLNHDALPVASGMYIAHVEMVLPANDKKVTKVLKLAIIQEQEVLDVY